MTLSDFENLLSLQSWDIVIWDKDYAYKPSGYTSGESISLQAIDGFGDYQYLIMNKDNCEHFEVRLTGEMKALLYLSNNQFRKNFKNLADML
jgi:hypothetical protein